MKLRKLLEKIKRPPKGMLIAVYIATVVFVALSVFIAVKGGFGYFTYAVYAFAAILLFYSVYTIVIYSKQIKSGIKNFLSENAFTSRLISDYKYRIGFFAVVSFVFNIGYSVFELSLSLVEKSLWLGILAAYYVTLAIARFTVIIDNARTRKKDGDFFRKAQKTYFSCGIMLIALSAISAFMTACVFLYDDGFRHPGLAIFMFAAYTFYKLTVAIINFVKSKKSDDYILRTVRNINLADAAVSVFALQTAMVNEFSQGGGMREMNLVTGIIVSLVSFILGVYSVVTSAVKLKNNKLQGTE